MRDPALHRLWCLVKAIRLHPFRLAQWQQSRPAVQLSSTKICGIRYQRVPAHCDGQRDRLRLAIADYHLLASGLRPLAFIVLPVIRKVLRCIRSDLAGFSCHERMHSWQPAHWMPGDRSLQLAVRLWARRRGAVTLTRPKLPIIMASSTVSGHRRPRCVAECRSILR